MKAWLHKAVESKYIIAVDSLTPGDAVYCVAHEHEWYEAGVVINWSALHRGLVGKIIFPPLQSQISEFMRFGFSLQGNTKLATSLELNTPWCIIPLSEQAQRLSVFIPISSSNNNNNSNNATTFTINSSLEPHHVLGKAYRFLKGPPGQRSVRDDLYNLLQNVNQQLVKGGVKCHIFLSTVVIIADEFDKLLHHTTLVYRALKGAGFDINANGSSFEPRCIFNILTDRYWNTMSLNSLQRKEDIVKFIVELFYLWLSDCYIWLCKTPSHALLSSSKNEDKKLEIFREFYTNIVLPRYSVIEFIALKDITVEEVLQLAAPHLIKKINCVGPQKWSIMELRLCLCALKAYDNPFI